MKKTKVLFKDEPVGILEDIGTISRFIYNADAQQQIACALPLYQAAHEWTDGLHPFFDNLSSEGYLRRIQSLNGQADEEDTFGIISMYGKDFIGAVSLVNEETEHLKLDANEKSRPALEVNKTISGVQPKVLAYKIGNKYFVSTPEDPALYIAKVNTEELEHIVWNEAITLSLAQEVLGKNKVVEFQHTGLEGREGLALIVKRFDRTECGEKLKMEDFAQILNRKRKDKYKGSYEEIAAEIDKYSSSARIDKMYFFELMVFNCLIGNTDAHLKNFALYESAQGGLRFSPAYDLVNTYQYIKNGYDHKRLALKMNGEDVLYADVTYKTLEKFGLEIGLNRKLIEEVITKMVRKLKESKKIKELSGENINPDDFRSRYLNVVEESCQRILEI